MNFAKYRVQLSTEKKYSSKYEYKYEYEYSIPGQSLCQNHISVSSNSSVFIFMLSDLKSKGKSQVVHIKRIFII